jgi:hypothetical protein
MDTNSVLCDIRSATPGAPVNDVLKPPLSNEHDYHSFVPDSRLSQNLGVPPEISHPVGLGHFRLVAFRYQ